MSTDDIIQWFGAVFIIAGHSLNVVGPSAHPWNILAFFIGTVAFLVWTVRVGNKPQLVVNSVVFCLGVFGLIKSIT